MKSDECSRIEALLHNVSDGEIAAVRHSAARDFVLQTEQFFPQGAGKGQIDAYSVFPGVDAAYHVFMLYVYLLRACFRRARAISLPSWASRLEYAGRHGHLFGRRGYDHT